MRNYKWILTMMLALPLASNANDEKEVIWFQSGNTPVLNQAFTNNINDNPMQGFTVTVPLVRTVMSPGSRFSYSAIYNQLSSRNLEGINKDLYVRIFADRCADFFDDWSDCYSNFKNVAKAAKELGFKGIMFDPEEYSIDWWDYPVDVSYPNKSLKEYEARARLVGKNIMDAIESEWPGVVFIDVKGSWKSDATVWWFGTLTGGRRANKSELIGPLFAGFIEGKDASTKLYDGGQIYGLRDIDDFEDVYEHRKNVTKNQGWVGDVAENKWDEVGISFVSMNYEYPIGVPMNANIMRTTLTNSLKVADDFAILYTEAGLLDVVDWIKNPMQNHWKSAVQDALDNVNNAAPTPITPPVEPIPDPGEEDGIITGIKQISDRLYDRRLHAKNDNGRSPVKSVPARDARGSQQWEFEHLQNNRYRIKNLRTQLYLTSVSNKETNSVFVKQLDNKSKAQKWNLIEIDGYYQIRNGESGMNLSTLDAKGSNISQGPNNPSDPAQQFAIE